MADKNIGFPLQDQQDILATKCGYVAYSSTFTSGTSKTTDTGLEEVAVGTILKDSASSPKVYLVTAINATTFVITGIALN